MDLLLDRLFEFTNQPISIYFLSIMFTLLSANILISIYHSYIFYYWKKRFDYFIIRSSSLTDEEIKNYEEEIESSPHKVVLKSIKDLLKDSKELSVTDINLLVEEKILAGERYINIITTGIFSVGLIFTLIGVFIALDKTFIDAGTMQNTDSIRGINIKE